MQVSFTEKSIQLAAAERELAERKLQRLARYFRQARQARITHTRERQQDVVEVQVDLDGRILRAEAQAGDFRSALDLVVERLEKQVRRTKDRMRSHKGRTSAVDFVSLFADLPDEASPEGEQSQGSIVRRKRFAIKPMTEEEAALQMEMLQHNFFAFFDATSGEFNVVYRREDGNYGLLEVVEG